MILTGAFLAESATEVDGKLRVEGGVLSRFRVGFDRVASLSLVALTQSEPHDTAPRLTIRFVTPSGDFQTEQIEMPPVFTGSAEPEPGFACWPLWLPVETDGRYTLVVTADHGSVTLPLTVQG